MPLKDLWQKFPRRRRGRFWRYVSPQRHGVGVFLLCAILLIGYGVWYQTNGRRIRHMAQQYLHELTGMNAGISDARFSFFEGIQLEGVRLRDAEAQSPKTLFFQADKVVLRHNPWALLVGGRIEPTEIVCIKPVVTLEYQSDKEDYNLSRLLLLFRGDPQKQEGAPPLRIPPIRVREGQLAAVDVDWEEIDGQKKTVISEAGRVPLEVSMYPSDGGKYYVIKFEETDQEAPEIIEGEVVIDIETGEVVRASSAVPLARLENTLPRRIRQWKDRYQLSGNIRIVRSTETAPAGNILTAELDGVSMRLPEEEGGLELVGVKGKLLFDSDGVTVDSINGFLPQAGNSAFVMDGRYDGYETDAPYFASLKVRNMTIPEPEGEGLLFEALGKIHELYQPQGRLDLEIHTGRDEQGVFSYRGQADLRGMSLVFKYFPYPIEDLQGNITFESGRISLNDLTGYHQGGKLVFSGDIHVDKEGIGFDVRTRVSDGPFDQELRDALPEDFSTIYDSVDPQGRGSADVRVTKAPEEELRISIHLLFDGRASIEYDGFPYRLEQLAGEVHIQNRSVRLEHITGSRGPARCEINGTLEEIGTAQANVKITVEGENLPLDDTLADAVGPGGRKAFEQIRPQGQAKQFHAEVWKVPGEPLDYRVTGHFEQVKINLEIFPYPVEEVRGSLTFRPGMAVLESLTGEHEGAIVTAGGQIGLTDPVGLDLLIKVTNLPLDDALREAIPARQREIWEQLQPRGLADLSLMLQHNLPDPGETDYLLEIDARNAGVTYQEFPYPLEGIHGRIVVTPGKIVLKSLSVDNGAMKGRLEGVLTDDGHRRQAELKLTATKVPIDEKLLHAVPKELELLAKQVDVGGTCDFNLDRIRFDLLSPAATPAGQPLADSIPVPKWNLDGSAQFKNTVINLGFGKKELSGRAKGSISKDARGLAVDADIHLDTITVDKYQVTDLRGKLSKISQSKILRLDDIEARAAGGYMAGYAQVELDDPFRYGINLTVDRIRLEELFPPNPEENKNAPTDQNMRGLLAGSLELIETVGKPQSRRAKGVLRISEAQLYRLPILLDMLTVVTLSLPAQSAFHEGEFIYNLKGHELTFEELYLRGPQLSLVGSGTMNMKSKALHLKFLGDPLGQLPRLSGLADELLTNLWRELMEIEVTGTVSNPKTRTRTLGSLEDTLREIRQLGGG